MLVRDLFYNTPARHEVHEIRQRGGRRRVRSPCSSWRWRTRRSPSSFIRDGQEVASPPPATGELAGRRLLPSWAVTSPEHMVPGRRARGSSARVRGFVTKPT